ncbi:MAG: L-threonylcarbamoyladenylate synthase [Nitrososphaerota archaeon]
MNTKVFKVGPDHIEIRFIEEAVKVIRDGGLVVFPTETVYGLGADTFNRGAIVKIFEAKGRPLDNPLIIHIASTDQLEEVVDLKFVKLDVYRLMEKFWPGPLTFILPKAQHVPYEVTAGRNTVAVRMPAHPVALKLIELSRTPIAAPSANLSGKPSPTLPEHVIKDMMGRVDVILDSGETLYGVESTIIDLTRDPPILLRPGAVPVEEVEKYLQKKIVVPDFARGIAEAPEPLSPGMKYRHYAPNTPLIVLEAEDYSNLQGYVEKILEYISVLKSSGKKILVLASRETENLYRGLDANVLVLGSRKNLFEIAKNLFPILRSIDELGVDLAVVEGFEERGLGLTIMNRLRKASGYNIVKI